MANKNPGFRALTIKHNGMANRIITEIGVTPPFEMSQIIDNKLPYEVITKQALWDTGATNSVITPETARQLNLTPVGAREVIHFGGKKQSNTHLLNFILPNNVVTPGILVTESDDIINGDSAHISSSFLRLSIFLAGRLRRPHPSAGNANRYALR